MRALRGEDEIVLHGRSGEVRFSRLWAGVGRPETAPAFVCVVGERLDSKYHCVWEKQGALWEVADALVWARRHLMIDVAWMDGRDASAVNYLRSFDDLCEPLPRCSEPLIIAPLPEEYAANFRTTLEKVRAVIDSGRLFVHDSNCPKITYALRQPVEELVTSPVIKALAWVVCGLEMNSGDCSQPEPAPWYGNPER
jgi:hypothetical protein